MSSGPQSFPVALLTISCELWGSNSTFLSELSWLSLRLSQTHLPNWSFIACSSFSASFILMCPYRFACHLITYHEREWSCLLCYPIVKFSPWIQFIVPHRCLIEDWITYSQIYFLGFHVNSLIFCFWTLQILFLACRKILCCCSMKTLWHFYI